VKNFGPFNTETIKLLGKFLEAARWDIRRKNYDVDMYFLSIEKLGKCIKSWWVNVEETIEELLPKDRFSEETVVAFKEFLSSIFNSREIY
jgi:hypothetical protein